MTRNKQDENDNVQTELQLADQTETALAGKQVVSMSQAVVEHQVDAAHMAQYDRFTILAVESIDSRFGQRIVITTLVPGERGTFVFTLGVPDAGKSRVERLHLLELFQANPQLVLADCCVVAVDTTYGQPAYLLRSTEQREVLLKTLEKSSQRQASKLPDEEFVIPQ